MKKILLFTAIIIGLYSCSDSTSPTNLPEVSITSELTSIKTSTYYNDKSSDKPQANEVDSIKISSIRVLMEEIKLFGADDDTSGDGRLRKTGPYVYTVDSANTVRILMSGSVPVGKYDKIKLELHRFSSSEYLNYTNNTELKDFATSDRYSTIVKGYYYKSGIATPFTYNGTTNVNLEFKFIPLIDLTEGSKVTFSIQLDPSVLFKKAGNLLDPTDTKNKSEIENNIKSMLKAVKK